MEEASGARVDSVGSLDMAVNGTGFSQALGKDGSAVQGDGNGYLASSTEVAPDDFTIAFWAKRLSAGQAFLFGIPLLWGVDQDDTQARFFFYDQTTGDYAVATIPTGNPPEWVLYILRFHNSALSMQFRAYQIPSNEGVDYGAVDGSGPWANPLANIAYGCFHDWSGSPGVSAGVMDEVMAWDRYLTDDQCDALRTTFYAP